MDQIAVIGTSPVNILLSVLLSSKGHKVTLFEHRSLFGGVWCVDSPSTDFDNTPHIINLTRSQHKLIQDHGFLLDEDLSPSFLILTTDDLSSRLAIAPYNDFTQTFLLSLRLLFQRSRHLPGLLIGFYTLLKRSLSRLFFPYKTYIPSGGWPAFNSQLRSIINTYNIC